MADNYFYTGTPYTQPQYGIDIAKAANSGYQPLNIIVDPGSALNSQNMLPSISLPYSMGIPSWDELGKAFAAGLGAIGGPFVGQTPTEGAKSAQKATETIANISVSRIITIMIGLIAIFAGFSLLGSTAFADAIRSLKP